MGMAVFRLAQTTGVGRFAARDARGEPHSRRRLQRGGAEALCDSPCAQGIGLLRFSCVHRAFQDGHVRWGTTTHTLWARSPVVLAQHTSYPVFREAHRSSPELVRYHALHAFRVARELAAREEFLRRHEQISSICAGPLTHGRQWNRARARARRWETKSLKRFGKRR